MKKSMVALAIAIGLAFGASAQKGPIVDRILVDAKTQEDIAIKDVAAGKSDVFWNGVDGAVYKGLPEGDKAKLDTYAVPDSYWSLLFNPVPNKAPFTVTKKDGKTYFNPFAIREVRFAMNFLINRKQMVDEILVGAGQAKFNPTTLGQPNSGRYATIASKLGMTATGNEKKALEMIDAAMKAAAELPENKGKLAKTGQWWTFNGEPVTINFLIRVDDPNGRLKGGRYVADQIEKAGIKVNRLEYDRAKCSKIYRNGDPADYEWNIYTEGWGGGQTYAFWEGNFAQMYAPWYANMPGGQNAGMWNYENAALDSLTQDAVNGRVKNIADYYLKCVEACEIGLKEAVRVFLVDTTSYYLASKDRFVTRMVYGIGDGLNRVSALTADVKPDTSGPYKGQKVLRMSEFSARGGLFMASWDPIGPDGFGDTYSGVVARPNSDMEFDANPVTGMYASTRATAVKFQAAAPVEKNGKMTGTIPVPPAAVIWNALTQKWESGIVFDDVNGDGSEFKYVKNTGDMAYATATFKFSYAKWHHGRMMDQNDFRYAIALPYDLSVKKGDSDKVYEESYSASISPNLPRTRGVVFNNDGTITTWGNSYYPMDETYNASLICPSLMVQASNYGVVISWEILEALKYLVAEGSASKTVYSFSSSSDFTEVDIIAEKCVADIKAKLEEFVAKKHVPAALVGFVTPDQAVANYKLAIAFIEKYKHAYISNGAFMIENYNPSNNTLVLAANRDPSYPFTKGQLAKQFVTSFARIDGIKAAAYTKGRDLTVTVTVSEVAFPANTAKAAAKANVKVTLMAGTEIQAVGKMIKAGTFTATFPAAAFSALKAGSYTIVVEAALGTESGAVDTATVIIF